MLTIALILFVLGLVLGSFVNALVWRLREKRNWVSERSECVHCHHTLAASDLVPVLSWLSLRGRCRYCRRRISAQYPIVELGQGLIFSLSYWFWPAHFGPGQLVLFTAYLAASIGLMSLLIYDLKWLLLPNKLIYPTALVAAAGNLVYVAGFAPHKLNFLAGWALGVVVASGIFGVLYAVSDGRWIGFGDVRLGLVSGTLLYSPGKAFLMIFLASILGTAFVIPSVVAGKKSLSARLPYGPFLISATLFCVLFGERLINWYLNSLSI